MREIKFRAWDKKEHLMRNVVNLIYFHDKELALVILHRGYKNVIEKPIDDVVLMQYTGLKDKNGKEIYEGDIVHGVRYCDDRLIETTGKVIWSYCELMIEDERGTYDPFLNYYEDFYINELSEIEVVGNIYENLELIKEGKE